VLDEFDTDDVGVSQEIDPQVAERRRFHEEGDARIA
jgi:hypothetical protein